MTESEGGEVVDLGSRFFGARHAEPETWVSPELDEEAALDAAEAAAGFTMAGASQLVQLLGHSDRYVAIKARAYVEDALKTLNAGLEAVPPPPPPNRDRHPSN